MANYAQVIDGKVTNIIIAEWNDIQDWPGSEFWIEYSEELDPSINPKKHPARIGGNYDAELDIFWDEQPYDSWTTDEDYNWQPPHEMPDDGSVYRWNEEEYQTDNTQGWEQIDGAVSGN